MVGFSRISPISVAPPWQSALRRASNGARTSRGCASPMCPTLPASAWKRRSTRFAAAPRRACASSARMSSRSHSTLSDGREPYQTWRGVLDGRAAIRAARANRRVRPQSERQCRSRTETDRARFRRRRSRPAWRCFDRFHKLFERYDVLLTPAAPVKPYPCRDEFSRHDQRQAVSRITSTGSRRLILITLVSLPAGDRARRPDAATACRSACRSWRRASRSR